MRVVFPALLLLPTLASAVDVQGVLPAGDTVWKRDLSPYVLTGDVTVPWGAKLTVESGVQIIAVPEDALRSGVDPQRVELIVDGTLLVRGTPAQPVEFTSHGTPGAWYGVRVRGGRGTVIDGARIDQASQGILLGMSATVKNSTVGALAADCIQATFGTSSLQNNDVRACGGRENVPPPRPAAPVAAPTPAPLAPSVQLPTSRERPTQPRLPETPVIPEATVRRPSVTPAPVPTPTPSRALPTPSDSGDCALEPQVREPPECPGVRQWRKNQERLGDSGSTRPSAPPPNASDTSRSVRGPGARPSLP